MNVFCHCMLRGHHHLALQYCHGEGRAHAQGELLLCGDHLVVRCLRSSYCAELQRCFQSMAESLSLALVCTLQSNCIFAKCSHCLCRGHGLELCQVRSTRGAEFELLIHLIGERPLPGCCLDCESGPPYLRLMQLYTAAPRPHQRAGQGLPRRH